MTNQLFPNGYGTADANKLQHQAVNSTTLYLHVFQDNSPAPSPGVGRGTISPTQQKDMVH